MLAGASTRYFYIFSLLYEGLVQGCSVGKGEREGDKGEGGKRTGEEETRKHGKENGSESEDEG